MPSSQPLNSSRRDSMTYNLNTCIRRTVFSVTKAPAYITQLVITLSKSNSCHNQPRGHVWSIIQPTNVSSARFPIPQTLKIFHKKYQSNNNKKIPQPPFPLVLSPRKSWVYARRKLLFQPCEKINHVPRPYFSSQDPFVSSALQYLQGLHVLSIAT